MKQVQKMARQGDVLVYRVDEHDVGSVNNSEKVPLDNGRHILAYGEVTGHAHAFVDDNVTMFRDPKLNELFFNTHRGVEIRHEEHGPIPLAPGKWRARRQREYTERQAPRWVAD